MRNANYNIGDLITRINNGLRAGHRMVEAPFGKDNNQVLNELTKLGVIEDYLVESSSKGGYLKFIINLNKHYVLPSDLYQGSPKNQGLSLYTEDTPVRKLKGGNTIILVSKPGKRIYTSYKDISNFNNGFKLYLIRTSKGIISSQAAIKHKLGGEVLLKLVLS